MWILRSQCVQGNQLESQEYLVRQGHDFPVLGVPRKGYWLLAPEKYDKTEDDLPVVLVDTRRKEPKAARKGAEPVANFDRDLFAALRKERARIAARLGVPAYLVFGDKSLQDMAAKQPTTESAFLGIFGVGRHKLEKFGAPMLRLIAEHKAGG